MNIFQKIIINFIKLYQKILSPDHSVWAKALNKTPYCKYIPSCSEYMIERVERKWAFIWFVNGILRILKCMPWNKWWYDPVEKEKK